MSRPEAASAQRQFAADNDAIADRLAAGGFDGLASVYRHSAREHEAAARRLDTEAAPDAPSCAL